MMASITVRNLDEGLKQRLRVRAAENGRSMEQEVREILKEALETGETKPTPPMTGKEWYDSIRALVEPLGGVELEIPPRTPMRPPPTFD